MRTISIALLILAIVSADNWAVLACGSKGYLNYRHQSDTAHIYQILKRGGFKEDHIITLLYNDVIWEKQNPFKGQLYNHPGDDSPDVYAGIVIDYENNTVTVENYLKVITGDESAGGKVLKSTKDDNVFLFFSDHGGRDILCFPDDHDYLYSKDLLEATQTMHDKQMYKKLFLYIEACHSGSMFANLPADMNVMAITAAKPTEA